MPAYLYFPLSDQMSYKYFWRPIVPMLTAAVLISPVHAAGKRPLAFREKMQPMTRPGHADDNPTAVDRIRKTAPGAFLNSAEIPQSQVELLAKDTYEKSRGYRFNKIIRGNMDRKEIALTFDDGPHEGYTLKLLQILKQTHTPATFFVVGKQVEKFPTLVQLEVIEGHEVGDHTYDHVNLNELTPEMVEYEIDQCDRAIKRVTGSSVRFFRPPGGNYNQTVLSAASRRGYITALWTDDPGDWARIPGDVILQRSLDRLENGAILLLHDGIQQTLDILPQLISEARARGYKFVTLSQLAMNRDKKDIEPMIVGKTKKF
jgi:peptidoglycan/xylan/chitin deacetylase (PgdA/CDA1 family)